MKITLLQMDIAWMDVDANIQFAERAILDAPTSDLYVLPEMWSTGFVTNPSDTSIRPLVLENSVKALSWMKETANRLRSAIAGSLAFYDMQTSTYRNRFFFIKPDVEGSSSTEYYDKRHLFTYGGEDKQYEAGISKVVVEWRGVRFLLQVCYDLRFPRFCRNELITDESGISSPLYDCILYVASWPETRIAVWRTLLPARAIENQCYVCGVNRVGTDASCTYTGATLAVDPYGRCVAKIDDAIPSTVSFELNLPKLQSFRRKFPVLNDMD